MNDTMQMMMLMLMLLLMMMMMMADSIAIDHIRIYHRRVPKEKCQSFQIQLNSKSLN